MHSIIEIDSIQKPYANRQLLTDVYLKCETGDILGILGRNGTGKSTLLKIIFGITKAERKFIRIDGKVYDCPYKTINQVSYLAQDTFLPKNLNVHKIVRLSLDKKKVVPFLKDKVLSHLLKTKIADLSGGELKYLEIKILLNSDSKFVLLDEPFNGISPILIEKIKEQIKIHSKTKGILLTDHQYQNVLEISTQNFLIHEGALKKIKNKSELVRWGYISPF